MELQLNPETLYASNILQTMDNIQNSTDTFKETTAVTNV
jgi:hypothetical protein